VLRDLQAKAEIDAEKLQAGKRKRELTIAREMAEAGHVKNLESPASQWKTTALGALGWFGGKEGKQVEEEIKALAASRKAVGIDPMKATSSQLLEGVFGDNAATIDQLRLKAKNQALERRMGKPILGLGTKVLPGILAPEGPQAALGGVGPTGLYGALASTAMGAMPGAGPPQPSQVEKDTLATLKDIAHTLKASQGRPNPAPAALPIVGPAGGPRR
jgi:hypothetical protein